MGSSPCRAVLMVCVFPMNWVRAHPVGVYHRRVNEPVAATMGVFRWLGACLKDKLSKLMDPSACEDISPLLLMMTLCVQSNGGRHRLSYQRSRMKRACRVSRRMRWTWMS